MHYAGFASLIVGIQEAFKEKSFQELGLKSLSST